MKTRSLSLILLILTQLGLSSVSWAQVGELYNADLDDKTSITNPAKAMKSSEGQWLAFSIPTVEGTRSPCCWKGKWNGMGEVGCNLGRSHHSYGTRSDSPIDENAMVLGKIEDGQVVDLRVVGESCPVNADGLQVTWIGEVNEIHGLNWLEKVSKTDDDHSALHALAIYHGKAAGERLYSLAKTNDDDMSENAIFWLGNSRGQQGFTLLEQLLAELPEGETRRQINFALSQNSSAEAAELLSEIARADDDPEQRGEAMFWLAQEYPQQAQDWLLEVINTEQDEDVLEQAVFAISQLPHEVGDMMLLELAQDDQKSRTVRRQAIFWLANSDSDSSVAALTELLTR